jgi:hypothetical protein
VKNLFSKKKAGETPPAGAETHEPEEAKQPVEMKAPPRFRREEGGKIVFPAIEVPLWKEPDPEPTPKV